jgi:thiol-disulfide isomerase/thioredoxin
LVIFAFGILPLLAMERGETAPDFEAVDFDGRQVKLSDFKGKPLLLNFWATWCPPCLKELPEFQRFFDEHNEDVNIVAVNLTTSERSVLHVKNFVLEKKLTFPVYLDEDGLAAQKYLVRYIPTSYFLDENLKILEVHVGPLTYEQIKDKFGL